MSLFRHTAGASRPFTAADGDEKMVAEGFDLFLGVSTEYLGEWIRLTLGKERWHSRSRKDLLRISDPLQHPVGPQTFVGQLKVRSKIFRCLPGRNRVACRMAALTFRLLEKFSSRFQRFGIGIDIRVDERIINLVEG